MTSTNNYINEYETLEEMNAAYESDHSGSWVAYCAEDNNLYYQQKTTISSKYFDDLEYNSENKTLDFYIDGEVKKSIDVSPWWFEKDSYYTREESDAKYINNIGTSGNNLTYTIGDNTNNITVPYATSANTTPWSGITDTPTTVQGYGITDMYDGVFVMCCQNSDGNPYLVKPSQYHSGYNYAIGIAIIEKGYPLIISLNDLPLLQWSSGSVNSGGYTTWNRQSAMFDFAGQSNTSSQVTHAECSGNTYAPGYCHNYSKIDLNNHGIKAGSWWLPSLGEWLIIFANQTKINYALSKIKGTDLIGGYCYFTSTEVSNDNVWWGDLSGIIYQYNAKTRTGYARPVSYYLW